MPSLRIDSLKLLTGVD